MCVDMVGVLLVLITVEVAQMQSLLRLGMLREYLDPVILLDVIALMTCSSGWRVDRSVKRFTLLFG